MYPATKIIAVTGAESTGKSTLTRQLAKHFSVPFIQEPARTYIEKLDRRYTYSDVVKISKIQVNSLNQLLPASHPYVFLDTWLIITQVWFKVVFHKEPAWLENAIQKSPIDLFLVCDTDLPWVEDPVRENGGNMRQVLQNMYIESLEKYKFNYKIVSGEKEERLQMALKYIAELQ